MTGPTVFISACRQRTCEADLQESGSVGRLPQLGYQLPAVQQRAQGQRGRSARNLEELLLRRQLPMSCDAITQLMQLHIALDTGLWNSLECRWTWLSVDASRDPPTMTI